MVGPRPILGLASTAAVVLLVSACTPSLYPLYRDYEVQADTGSVEARIEQSLAAAGWYEVPPPADNVIATNERTVRRWGVYDVVVSLEILPLGGGYVRILVHPYRQYLWGTRSKVPYLNGTIRRSVLRDVDAAMAANKLVAVGSGMSRDRENTR